MPIVKEKIRKTVSLYIPAFAGEEEHGDFTVEITKGNRGTLKRGLTYAEVLRHSCEHS